MRRPSKDFSSLLSDQMVNRLKDIRSNQSDSTNDARTSTQPGSQPVIQPLDEDFVRRFSKRSDRSQLAVRIAKHKFAQYHTNVVSA